MGDPLLISAQFDSKGGLQGFTVNTQGTGDVQLLKTSYAKGEDGKFYKTETETYGQAANRGPLSTADKKHPLDERAALDILNNAISSANPETIKRVAVNVEGKIDFHPELSDANRAKMALNMLKGIVENDYKRLNDLPATLHTEKLAPQPEPPTPAEILKNFDLKKMYGAISETEREVLAGAAILKKDGKISEKEWANLASKLYNNDVTTFSVSNGGKDITINDVSAQTNIPEKVLTEARDLGQKKIKELH